MTPEERDRYTLIIDEILGSADLETISRKKIRQGLQAALGGQDLSDQKVCNLSTSIALASCRFHLVSSCLPGTTGRHQAPY